MLYKLNFENHFVEAVVLNILMRLLFRKEVDKSYSYFLKLTGIDIIWYYQFRFLYGGNVLNNNNNTSGKRIIPYRSIKKYKNINTDKNGSITLIDPITEKEEIKGTFVKVFFNDSNEIVFVEIYNDFNMLDSELIINKGIIEKKLIFDKNGKEDFYILYKYKDSKIVEEKAFTMNDKPLYKTHRDKKGFINKLSVYKI